MAGGPFEALDGKLTIYALANGMDLLKERPDQRVLTWYLDGRERGIILDAEASGTLRVSAASWETRDREHPTLRTLREGVDAGELGASLSASFEEIMEAANEL